MSRAPQPPGREDRLTQLAVVGLATVAVLVVGGVLVMWALDQIGITDPVHQLGVAVLVLVGIGVWVGSGTKRSPGPQGRPSRPGNPERREHWVEALVAWQLFQEGAISEEQWAAKRDQVAARAPVGERPAPPK